LHPARFDSINPVNRVELGYTTRNIEGIIPQVPICLGVRIRTIFLKVSRQLEIRI